MLMKHKIKNNNITLMKEEKKTIKRYCQKYKYPKIIQLPFKQLVLVHGYKSDLYHFLIFLFDKK